MLVKTGNETQIGEETMADVEKEQAKRPISQKALAEHLKLSPSTVSLVMNDAPRAKLIPEATRKRILDAAAKFDYRPDFYARYLYSKRSFTVAVVLAGIREPYAAAILAGIDRKLVREKYLYFTANHYGQEDLIREYPRRLLERAVEGFLLINTTLSSDPGRPTVMIGSAPKVEGFPRFALNNDRGGALALEYLVGLGHRNIAVIKGHPWRSAAAQRFAGTSAAAKAHGIKLDERLVKELHSGNTPREMTMPEEGYKCGMDLLAAKVPFTALIAFNDVTAIGAIRAFKQAGVRVPEDVSVVGFDDIESAGYLTPSLTTLRQPLEQMGELAAEHLIAIINEGQQPLSEVLVDPELIERESTARLGGAKKAKNR
jgi:DNA-binding LacI/PurR family transcriptional regulator